MKKSHTYRPRLATKHNRFVALVGPPPNLSIIMDVPDEVPMPTIDPTPESVAVFVCPRCHTERFASQRFLDLLKELPTIHEAIEQAFPRHAPCNAIMRLEPLHPPDT